MTVWPNGSPTIPRVSSEFGARTPIKTPNGNITQSFHYGIDLVGYPNNKSPVNGVVIFAAYNGGAGNQISIRGDNGDVFVMMHNARFLVRKGARVREGQDVGVMGTTGNSTGVHCHFEVRPGGGAAVNPRGYMPRTTPAGSGAIPIIMRGTNTMYLFRTLNGTIYLITPLGAVGIQSIPHLILLQRILGGAPGSYDTFNDAERDIVFGYLAAAQTSDAARQAQLIAALGAIKFDAGPIVTAVTAAIKALGTTNITEAQIKAIAAEVDSSLDDEFGGIPENVLGALSARLAK